MGRYVKSIAYQYDLLPELIIEVNQITNPSLIYAGQQLLLPAPDISETGPGYKIIPDSELVRSPYTVRFQIEAFINNQPGYLKNHEEEIDGEVQTAAEIIAAGFPGLFGKSPTSSGYYRISIWVADRIG